ncbi:MAG: TIGR03619 family F420-dependent LLM class oxidoreductase [Actinomycetota bacterium]
MTRPIRVGVQLPEVEREVRWPELRSMARIAEAVGFDSVWVGDHYLYRDDGRPERGPWEAWATLAGLAAITDRVRLGPLVACLGFHAPAVLAKTAVTVDEIAGGRLTLGIGAGWNRTEFDAFGIPFDRRAARFEEAFTVIRGLLAGTHVSFEGAFVHVNDAVLLPTPARRVPLMVGSTGERVLRATLPHVESWNTWFDAYGNTVEGFRDLNRRVSELAVDLARDPGRIERSACALIAIDGGNGERPPDPSSPHVTGSAAEIAAHLTGLAEAGADEAIVIADPITESSIEWLGDVLAVLDA